MALRAHGAGSGQAVMPMWQRAWLNAYPDDVPSSLQYPSIPVSALVEATAARFPEQAACTLYGHKTTYAQLADQARRFASVLANLGARPGRKVAMLLPNIPEYLVALQAA